MLEWLFGSRQSLLRKETTQHEVELMNISLWQSRMLSPSKRDKLIRWCRVFIAEKNWEGCNGQSITEEIQWAIAAAAGLMVLEYDGWYFDKTATLLVYPTPYKATVDARFVQSSNPILGGEFHRAGETIYRGPVILNWQDIEPARQHHNGGHHLVIHEFAHQLDMINGPSADGLPPLPNGVDEVAWLRAFKAEYHAARDLVAAGHRILMDDYGLTQESEFFAVACELFFQLPDELAEYHPQVFALLQQFFLFVVPDA